MREGGQTSLPCLAGRNHHGSCVVGPPPASGYKAEAEAASAWECVCCIRRLHYTILAAMARFLSTVAGLSLVSVALSTPLQSHQQQQLYSRQNASSPCAQVSASVATQSAVATPTVAAQLAYECITSVPFNQSAALDLVDGVVPYFKWQSNTAFLKDPPQEYAEKVQPAVDIWGELEKIRTKVASGAYANEFEVRIRCFLC
jgi:hypothetical protein